MKWMLALTVLVVACDRTTAPRDFTLGPGCWRVLRLYDEQPPHAEIAKLKIYNTNCRALNLDSLRTLGYEIVWDTTYAK